MYVQHALIPYGMDAAMDIIQQQALLVYRKITRICIRIVMYTYSYTGGLLL